ncbi:uncharacterized protein METZ01_LOCUS290197, partial [marine metagenome]
IKGVGVSSLAVEEDLFRNRVYLLRDREAEPGVLWQIIDGEANAADGLKFAPESTVFAHYTNADVEVAMETLRDALMQGGAELMPWEVRRMMEPLMEEMMGNVSAKDILAKHFSGELTEESKPFVGRWKIVHSRESKPAEILRRPDGTFVLNANKDELEGFWKVEDHKMHLAVFYQKGEIAPLERLSMIVAPLDEVKKDGFVTGEIEIRQLYNGRGNREYPDGPVMEEKVMPVPEGGIEDIPMPEGAGDGGDVDLDPRVFVCQANLQAIEGGLVQWALENRKADDASVTLNDLAKYFREIPRCPAGGKYILTTVGNGPRCSHPEHQFGRGVQKEEAAPSLPEAPSPPPVPDDPPSPENCEEPPVDDPEGEVHVLAAAGPGPGLERPKRPFFTETRLAKFT